MKHAILLVLAFTSLQHTALAQPDASAGAQQPRRISAILKDIRNTESDANELFNAFNSNDQYDLTCYQHVPTGSRLRQRICEPQFLKDARRRDASRFITGTREGTDNIAPQNETALQGMLQNEIIELRQELQTVAQQSPEFTARMQQLQALVKEYAAHRRARNNDPAIGFLARYLMYNAL